MTVRKMLIATDFSPSANSALQVATNLAHVSDASLIIAHVKTVPELPGADEDDVYDPAERVERLALENVELDDPKVTYRHQLLHGHPSEQLLHLAQKEAVDLIVMGSHGASNASEAPMGAVADAVLRKATCSVIIVKPPGPKTPIF